MIIIEKYMTEDLGLVGSDLVIYADIASNLNEYGEFIKTKAVIARDTGLSEKTVQRSIISLRDKKMIEVKAVRDGARNFNIISIKNKCHELVTDKDFKYILDYWAKLVCVEDLNKANYEAYQYLLKQPGFTMDSFKEAIRWYAETIKTSGYYKTFVYRFARFVYVYKKYLPGQYEQAAFMSWMQTHHEFIAQTFKPYDPEDCNYNQINDEDLGNCEI